MTTNTTSIDMPSTAPRTRCSTLRNPIANSSVSNMPTRVMPTMKSSWYSRRLSYQPLATARSRTICVNSDCRSSCLLTPRNTSTAATRNQNRLSDFCFEDSTGSDAASAHWAEREARTARIANPDAIAYAMTVTHAMTFGSPMPKCHRPSANKAPARPRVIGRLYEAFAASVQVVRQGCVRKPPSRRWPLR